MMPHGDSNYNTPNRCKCHQEHRIAGLQAHQWAWNIELCHQMRYYPILYIGTARLHYFAEWGPANLGEVSVDIYLELDYSELAVGS